MFGLFRPSKVIDPTLGELVRSRGYWRGTVSIGPYSNVTLAVAGGRAAPESAALAAAREVPTQFSAWRADIALAVHEHYKPYAEAIAAGELPSPGAWFPILALPSEVWPHLFLTFVCVGPLSGSLTVELGMNVEWDEEHILGARFQAGKFAELCGSTVPP